MTDQKRKNLESYEDNNSVEEVEIEEEEVEDAIEIIKDSELNPKQKREIQRKITLERSGPLPHPSEFEGYEKALPGAADRIMTMAEEEQKHRHRIEETEQEKYHDNAFRLTKYGISTGVTSTITSSIIGGFIAIFGNPYLGIGLALVANIPLILNAIGEFSRSKKGQAREEQASSEEQGQSAEQE